MSIQEELDQVKKTKWLKDMEYVKAKLDAIVKDEYDTSLEQFLMDYYQLKKELTPAPIPCAHDWDEGHNGVSKCKVCGKYSA